MDEYGQEPKNDYEEEDEDQVISKIKSIGSQIFTSFSDSADSQDKRYEELNTLDLDNRNLFDHSHKQDRKYSYTARCHKTESDGQELQQERKQTSGLNEDNQPKTKQKEAKRFNNVQEKGKTISQNFKKKIKDQKEQNKAKNTKNIAKQINKDNMVEKQESRRGPPALVNSRFMQPIGNFKQTLIKDVYEKALQQQLEYKKTMQKKKPMRTLQQLYQQKQPLYQRFMRDQLKKKMKMQQSRIEAFEKQLQDFVGFPTINTNIPVKGSFEERTEVQRRKKQEIKQRIMAESMSGSTFQPRISSPKKYKNVESKIKSIWKATAEPGQEYSQQQNLDDSMDMKGISQSLLRTGSFFSEDAHNSPAHKSFELKLSSAKELSYILQLDDLHEQQ